MKATKKKLQTGFNEIQLFILAIICLFSLNARANNIVVTNVSLVGQNTNAGINNSTNYSIVKFDISWNNSWRVSTGPSNWDAAWVFVKYRVGSGNWQHATLSSTKSDHTAPSGSTIDATSDGTGVFIYRNSEGTGNFSLTDVQLKWKYGLNGVTDASTISISVFAIEMVYVPQGSFLIGSGGTESGSFTNGSWISGVSIPFEISSEGALGIDNVSGKLWGTSTSGSNTIGNTNSDPEATISSSYPKGFSAFYCMKYEISQGQYVAFLNTLTRIQQDLRTATTLGVGTTSVTFRYVMCESSSIQSRNIIRCDASIHASNPITFYCDRDGDGIGNESNDGEFISANFLSWSDLSAYLDWAGLRPMTELEFEKVCRGTTSSPTANEYAWGTTSIIGATAISNSGLSNEIATNNDANVVYNSLINGPMRSGAFAKSSTNRITSGASYYGVFDMSGNVWERPITIGNSSGRAFTGLNGNGELSTNGESDVSNWPGNSGDGAGFRGGRWNADTIRLRISDRTGAASIISGRNNDQGGRGVRTAP
ncbi:MAG: SUMF1/EgtB/PvdO family nonheme iron enzyme [Bacteroidia bacterium]